MAESSVPKGRDLYASELTVARVCLGPAGEDGNEDGRENGLCKHSADKRWEEGLGGFALCVMELGEGTVDPVCISTVQSNLYTSYMRPC